MAAGAVGLKTHIWNNNLKSLALLAGFPVLLIGIAYAITALWLAYGAPPGVEPGGAFAEAAYAMPTVLPFVLGGAAIWFVIAWFSHQAIIDASTGAHSVERREEPELYNLLENLAISRGMTMPKLKIIETGGLNAYASGLTEKQYTVTVTRGLMNTLNRDELEGVLAHELTHIINRDVRLLVVSIIFVGIISLVIEVMFRGMLYSSLSRSGRGRKNNNAGVFILIAMAVMAVAWFLAIVVRFAISRKREYMADAGAVELTKNPDAMISALEKISGNHEIEKAPPEVRQMFIYDRQMGFQSLFATHPPMDKRIEALVRHAGGRRSPPSDGKTSIPAV